MACDKCGLDHPADLSCEVASRLSGRRPVAQSAQKKECLHTSCKKCFGYGVTPRGFLCVHNFVCDCERCKP